MASRAPQRPLAPVVVCADFDQSITTRDTIALLFEAANTKRPHATARAAHERQVQHLVEQYTNEYTTFMTSAITGPAASRFDAHGLLAFLKAFAAVDLRSIQRVVESKTLQGLERCDLEAIGANVDCMASSIDVLAGSACASVISSNWSQTMIRARLDRSGLDTVNGIANELAMDNQGVTTGEIDLTVQTPMDKAAIVQAQVASNDMPVVFIGDSTNDLLAMLHADVGIAVGVDAESTFARVCRQFRVDLCAISDFKELAECQHHAKAKAAANGRVVFTATTWKEIRAILATTGERSNEDKCTTIN